MIVIIIVIIITIIITIMMIIMIMMMIITTIIMIIMQTCSRTAARIHVARLPGLSNSGASLCMGDIHSSKIRTGSGQTPEFPDSNHISGACTADNVVYIFAIVICGSRRCTTHLTKQVYENYAFRKSD